MPVPLLLALARLTTAFSLYVSTTESICTLTFARRSQAEIEARGEGGTGVRRFFSLEKVNRGQGRTSTIEMHEGPRVGDVFHRAGADGQAHLSDLWLAASLGLNGS